MTPEQSVRCEGLADIAERRETRPDPRWYAFWLVVGSVIAVAMGAGVVLLIGIVG